MTDIHNNSETSDLDIVEFFLKAHELIRRDEFFDKDGKPQEGTELLNDFNAALTRWRDRAVVEARIELYDELILGPCQDGFFTLSKSQLLNRKNDELAELQKEQTDE
jgi:hypothetical protein